MGTATVVKSRLGGYRGDAALYLVNPPLRSDWDDKAYEFVVVSSVVTYSGPETFIFGADNEGEVQDWAELPGSLKGVLDHEQALEGAGYSIVAEAAA